MDRMSNCSNANRCSFPFSYKNGYGMPISKVIGRTAERVFTLNNAPVDAISRFDLSFITSLVLPNSGEKHIADNMHSWTQMNFVRS